MQPSKTPPACVKREKNQNANRPKRHLPMHTHLLLPYSHRCPKPSQAKPRLYFTTRPRRDLERAPSASHLPRFIFITIRFRDRNLLLPLLHLLLSLGFPFLLLHRRPSSSSSSTRGSSRNPHDATRETRVVVTAVLGPTTTTSLRRRGLRGRLRLIAPGPLCLCLCSQCQRPSSLPAATASAIVVARVARTRRPGTHDTHLLDDVGEALLQRLHLSEHEAVEAVRRLAVVAAAVAVAEPFKLARRHRHLGRERRRHGQEVVGRVEPHLRVDVDLD